MPKRNLIQNITIVPTSIVKFPFFLSGKAIKYTSIFIDENRLIPRTKALFTSDDGLIAFYPTVSWGGRSGLGGELNFFDKKFPKAGSRIYLQAGYSANGHQNHYIRYRIPEMFGLLSLDTRARYYVNTNEDFFGIGSETDRDARTNFRHEEFGGKLELKASLIKWLKAELLIDYTDHNIKEGDGTYASTLDKFDLETTPGVDGAALLGIGGSIAIDGRDNDFYPTKGSLAGLSVTVFNQTDDDKYGFVRYRWELSHCITLFRTRRVFAVRLLGEINTRLSDDKDTPFFERASLGGTSDLRGYSVGRFRDKDLILLNLEYRYPIWEAHRKAVGAMDAVIFVDIVRVFDDMMEDTFSDYEFSYGFGIRAQTTESFIFRSEIAASSEEVNFILRFEPIF